ncbi:MAG: hypothetical protein M1834_004239 [Cirrosporium novae-zelandiae]|nr:MAG: hypothetical protein M1834_004239 [Cirrosporium novae-zelandiae]
MNSIDLNTTLRLDARQYLTNDATATQWLLHLHGLLESIVDEYPSAKQDIAPKILSQFKKSLTQSKSERCVTARKILEETQFNNPNETLTNLIKDLKNNLHTFFGAGSILEPPDSSSTGETRLCYLLRILRCLDGMEKSEATVRYIRKRFYLTSFYLQARDTGYNNQWNKRVHEEFGSEAGGEVDFRKEFENRYALGRTYHEWAELAGGNGTLFLLPEVSNWGYKYIKLEERQRIVKQFQEHGLSEAINQDDLNSLANRLIDSLRSEVALSIPTVTFTTPSLSVNKPKRQYQKISRNRRKGEVRRNRRAVLQPSPQPPFQLQPSPQPPLQLQPSPQPPPRLQPIPVDDHSTQHPTPNNGSTVLTDSVNRNPTSSRIFSTEHASTSAIRSDVQPRTSGSATETIPAEQAALTLYRMQNPTVQSAVFTENRSQISFEPTSMTDCNRPQGATNGNLNTESPNWPNFGVPAPTTYENQSLMGSNLSTQSMGYRNSGTQAFIDHGNLPSDEHHNTETGYYGCFDNQVNNQPNIGQAVYCGYFDNQVNNQPNMGQAAYYGYFDNQVIDQPNIDQGHFNAYISNDTSQIS